MIAFNITKCGTVKGMQEYYAERANGQIIATISPRHEQSGAYSKRFLNVCYVDGKVDIADGIEHAADLIEAKYFH